MGGTRTQETGVAAETQTYTKRTTCRGCDSPDLTLVLDLGEQPLANRLVCECDTGPEPRFPLTLVRCEDCELVQLTVVVDPTILYGQHYTYRSGINPGWSEHCRDLAVEIVGGQRGANRKVLEIGCLDGVMLRQCRDRGCTVWGVDPSSPVEDVPVIREFWRKDINATGKADVIVAQNVFGHVDDARGFLEACEKWLEPDGQLIIEAPWIADLVDGVRWDTIYHEHLSYWGLRPLMRLATQVGLHVTNVRRFPDLHGGTMRYYLGRQAVVDPEVYAVWKDEWISEPEWRVFQSRVSGRIDYWAQWFHENASWTKVAVYGASAKLSTFLNALPTKPPILALFDDTPSKIGKYSPGWHFPILAPSHDAFQDLDVLLVGSPNWKADLERQARRFGFTGEVLSLWA